MRKPLLIFLALMCAVMATYAHATTVAGSRVQSAPGTILASGSWCFGASCSTVTNGAFSGSVTAGTATVTVASGGTTYFAATSIAISGASFSWDSFVLTGSATGIGTPYIACAIGATYSQTDITQAWSCNNIAGQPTWQISFTPPTQPTGSYAGQGNPTFVCTAPCTYTNLSQSPVWATTASTGQSSNAWQQVNPTTSSPFSGVLAGANANALTVAAGGSFTSSGGIIAANYINGVAAPTSAPSGAGYVMTTTGTGATSSWQLPGSGVTSVAAGTSPLTWMAVTIGGTAAAPTVNVTAPNPIPNSALASSQITINGTAMGLGGNYAIAGALPGGALGSTPYQTSAGVTAFIPSPTTTGTYLYAWRPTGSAVAPTALSLASLGIPSLSSTTNAWTGTGAQSFAGPVTAPEVNGVFNEELYPGSTVAARVTYVETNVCGPINPTYLCTIQVPSYAPSGVTGISVLAPPLYDNVMIRDERGMINGSPIAGGQLTYQRAAMNLELHAGANLPFESNNDSGQQALAINVMADGGTNNSNNQANLLGEFINASRANTVSARSIWGINPNVGFSTNTTSVAAGATATGVEIDLNNLGPLNDPGNLSFGIEMSNNGGFDDGYGLIMSASNGGHWIVGESVNNYDKYGIILASADTARSADIYIVPPANDTANEILAENAAQSAPVWRIDDVGHIITSNTVSATKFVNAAQCFATGAPTACGSAGSGGVAIGASNTSVVVDDTLVTADSIITVTPDESIGSVLGVTCAPTTVLMPFILSRASGTSFTLAVPSAVAGNPECFTFTISGN